MSEAVDVGSMSADFDTAGAAAAVKAAVEAAEQESAKDAPAQEAPAEETTEEQAPDTKPEKPAKKKDEEPAKAEGEDDEPKTISELQKVLKRREKEREFQVQAAQAKRELEQQMAEVAALRAEIERERAFYAELRTKPIEAIRKSGWNPDELILSLAKAGTPEGQLAARLEEEARARQTLEQRLQEMAQRDEERQKQAALQAQEAGIRAAEQRFVGFVNDPEVCPTLSRLFKGREHVIVAEGHRVAREYHSRTGQIPNERDIAEFLESEWAESGSSTTSQVGKAPQRRAASSATVSPSEASERRTVAKNLAEMSDDDRIREAKAAAIKAIKEASGQR